MQRSFAHGPLFFVLLVSFAVPAGAAFEASILFRDSVVVDADGNGVIAGEFPTPTEEPGVQYVLRIDNGCEGDARGRCTRRPRTPIDALQVLINDRVVFSGAVSVSEQVEVALEEAGGDDNRIILGAIGLPGSRARVTVAARLEVGIHGGRAVLPFATQAAILFLHDPGAVPLAYRVSLLNPDGTRAGRSAPARLEPGATASLSLEEIVTAQGIAWTDGAVHVDWAGEQRSLLVAGAAKERSGPALILPELGTSPLTPAGLEALAEGVLDPLGGE